MRVEGRTYFSALQFDQVLYTIDNAQSPVGIPLANITSTEPTVFRKDAFILVQIVPLEITRCDTRSTDEDLALGGLIGSEVAGVRNVKKLDLNRTNGGSGNSVLELVRGKNRTHATRLGQAVACQVCQHEETRDDVIAMKAYLGGQSRERG